jgi:hypothetical protein
MINRRHFIGAMFGGVIVGSSIGLCPIGSGDLPFIKVDLTNSSVATVYGDGAPRTFEKGRTSSVKLTGPDYINVIPLSKTKADKKGFYDWVLKNSRKNSKPKFYEIICGDLSNLYCEY